MLINCQNAFFGYEGRAVVKDLSFTVAPCDYLWVVGENGSGKTTLILGLLKLINPMEGNLVFHESLSGGGIGYLSQLSVLKKDFPAGVDEVVLSGNLSSMGWRPFYSAREKARADEAMERLGIKNLKKKCYRELSGGQQRRVLLARAFCAAQVDPSAAAPGGKEMTGKLASHRLLVLDEPAAGLDPVITAEVYELLKNLNEETGISIIMVSHDTRGARQYANNILHMEHGRGTFANAADYLKSDRGKKYFAHGEEKNDN